MACPNMLLNEPGKIGSLTLKNRIAMAPMVSNIADPNGNTNNNHVSYLEERAAGGVGLIITEYTYINDKNSRGSYDQLGFYDRSFIPKLRRLTERIHSHGTKIFAQLVHAGGKALNDVNEKSAVAPSVIEYPGNVPEELTRDEIEEIEEDFVRAARIAKDSNYDGIEIHGAHGYLVQEFISPALNKRTDNYGNSFDGRIRFANEIIEAVREEVHLPVGIRLSLYEDDQDGYGPEYGLKVAESLKNPDYVHLSAGRFSPPGSAASFYDPSFHIARKLPRKPNVTTMVVGSVRNRDDALEVMKKADFIAVGRAMLADPYFPFKLMNGHETIRPCIRCNQACRDLGYGEVRCTVNPETGFESMKRIPLQLNGEIAVIGGGVKGLEAALIASKHGLKVTLYEKENSLGGQLLQIVDEYKRREFLHLVEYYSNALRKAGVSIQTDQNYKGDGIYCLPDKIYPKLQKKSVITVDSNIYQHHDEILDLARESKIILSTRSLSSLDRSRRVNFESMLKKLGVEIVSQEGMQFDISITEARQYDIRAAMTSGRNVIENYLRQELNLFL